MDAPASRNAPCPCGSGRRYKECHGSPHASAGRGGTAAADVSALLDRALAAQRAGRLIEAAAGYLAALASAPENFDALHMLGIVRYQMHDFDAAEELLLRAVEINPGLVAARHNLALVAEARQLVAEEDRLCFSMLERLAPLCASPDRWPATLAAAMAPIDLLVGGEHPATLEAVEAFAATVPCRLRTWWDRLPPSHVLGPNLTARAQIPDLDVAATPSSSLQVLAGLDVGAVRWHLQGTDATIALLVDRVAPAALHDRLRELSVEGRRKVPLLYATHALAGALRLPGAVLDASNRN